MDEKTNLETAIEYLKNNEEFVVITRYGNNFFIRLKDEIVVLFEKEDNNV